MNHKTIEAYDAMAKEYDDETFDFWERFPRPFINNFARLARGIVLDVGSGPGRDGLLLQALGLKVICLDASTTMTKTCNARGLQAVIGDFTLLPFGNAMFNGVWAYTSLLHIPKSEFSNALCEMRRVLKDGGIFELGLIEGEGECYIETSGVISPRLFSYYTKEEIEVSLMSHGFEILEFDIFQPRTRRYLNFISRKMS